MAQDFADKSAARQWVWDRLVAEGVARFPFPPHGRIPNFAGAEVAAARLFNIEPWKSATAIKVNPDSPQRPLRAEARSWPAGIAAKDSVAACNCRALMPPRKIMTFFANFESRPANRSR